MRTKDNAILQNIILLAGSLIFAFVLLEIVLRMVLPAPTIWKYPQEEYQFDSETGHWLKHNQLAFTHDKPVRTNSIGIRDADYSSDAPPGVFRILALGDSQTFGNGLELVDTWPKQLEGILHKSCEKHIEVINGGIAGTDTWQHELIFQRLLESYNPDMVILAFYVNDVVKRFIPRPANKNRDSSIFVKTIYIMKRSVLLLSLRSAINSIRQLLSPSRDFLQQQALLAGDKDPAIMERWAQVEESLTGIKNESGKNDVDIVILALPRRDQIAGQLPWKGYYNQIKSIADSHDIPIVSTLESLQESYREYSKDLFIPWDGHNSRIANQVIAKEAVDAALKTRQLVCDH